jgi:hypothetical protein
MDAPVLLITLKLTWYRTIDIMYKVHTPIIPKVIVPKVVEFFFQVPLEWGMHILVGSPFQSFQVP